MGYKLSISFCTSLLLVSCAVKTKLDPIDLQWVNVYKENDTLVFRSEKGEFDTSIIIKKEFFYPEYNPVEQHGKYLPQWCIVWYKNKTLEYHPNGDQLITMEKKGPNETFLSINYLYSTFLILNLNLDSLERYKSGSVYKFNTYSSRAKPQEPKEIDWDEKYGITKYITHEGDAWELVKLNQSDVNF